VTTEAASAFVERLKTDEALRAKLAGADDRAERLALVRAEGFDLAADDIDAVKKALGVEELSDEDLERIAGGTGTGTSAVVSASGGVVSVAAVAAAALF
jgi:predicted ribosomally synthesized peptide with nif11-like leader